MRKSNLLQFTIATALILLISFNVFADLVTDRAVVSNNGSEQIAAKVKFQTPVDGDLYIATRVNGELLFLADEGNSFSPAIAPFRSDSHFSEDIVVLNISGQDIAPGFYPIFQVVTQPDSDPLNFMNWVGGLDGLSIINFSIGLPVDITGDFDKDGFSDDDNNHDGFHDQIQTPRSLSLVTDAYAVFTEPTVPEPFYLSPFTEPTFHTRVIRVAGNAGTSFSFAHGGSSTWNQYARHSYSKTQAWNADQSLLVFNNDGSRIYLDGNTYQPKFGQPAEYAGGDDRWHPTLPNIRIRPGYNTNTLEWYDVVNRVRTRNWTLPISVLGMGDGEGNTSSNGRYAALASATSMFIVDMDPQAPLASYASGNKRIGPVLNISDGGAIDWVSVSPSGKYVAVMYQATRLRVFNIDPTTLAITPRSLPGTSICGEGSHAQGWMIPIGHADMTMNPFDNNEDIIIGQKQSGCPGEVSSVMMLRLSDNAVTSLTRGDTATMTHISARNLQRPGWVYVTYYAPENHPGDLSGLRYSGELVALKIDGSGSVERLAHTHSYTPGNYSAQEHSVPSPDGKRALWASNWSLYGNGSDFDIKAYVVDTRP